VKFLLSFSPFERIPFYFDLFDQRAVATKPEMVVFPPSS